MGILRQPHDTGTRGSGTTTIDGPRQSWESKTHQGAYFVVLEGTREGMGFPYCRSEAQLRKNRQHSIPKKVAGKEEVADQVKQMRGGAFL